MRLSAAARQSVDFAEILPGPGGHLGVCHQTTGASAALEGNAAIVFTPVSFDEDEDVLPPPPRPSGAAGGHVARLADARAAAAADYLECTANEDESSNEEQYEEEEEGEDAGSKLRRVDDARG